MKGKGAIDDFFANNFDPNKNGLKHQFTHPDSNLNQAAKAAERALGGIFDPNKNGLREKVNAAVEDFKKVTQQLPDDIKRALDPNQNGVAAAFNKFGDNLKGAFIELGNKILAQAKADKAKLDEAFAPLVNEFKNPDSVLAKFIKEQVGTEQDWKKKFEDPDTYFLIASILLTAAAAVVTAPIGGVGAPIVFAALQTALACTKLIVHAAQGKPFNPMDAVDIVLAVGGPAIGKATGAIAGKAGVAAEKTAEKLGVWNRIYGGVAPAAPAAGSWIQEGMKKAGSGLAQAAIKNQVAYNQKRAAEAIGENLTAISTANLDTSANAPVIKSQANAATPAATSSQANAATSAATSMSEYDKKILAFEREQAQQKQTEKMHAEWSPYAESEGGAREMGWTPEHGWPGVPRGSGKPGSRLLSHTDKHLRGRGAHHNVDPSYFC